MQPISGTPPPESAAFLLTEQSRLSEQGRLTSEQGNRATDGRLTNEQGRPVDQGRLEGSNPEFHDRCDMKTIQKTCSLFGLDPVVFMIVIVIISVLIFMIVMAIIIIILYRSDPLQCLPVDRTQ